MILVPQRVRRANLAVSSSLQRNDFGRRLTQASRAMPNRTRVVRRSTEATLPTPKCSHHAQQVQLAAVVALTVLPIFTSCMCSLSSNLMIDSAC